MLSTNTKKDINSRKHLFSANSNVELSNQYSLKIVIESICWLKDLPDDTITISFCNPIYQKFYTIPNPVNLLPNELTYLENIQCRMNLEIPFDKVHNIFAHWSPTILICNKDNIVLTQCNLDLNTFKLNRSKQRIFVRQSLYGKDNENDKLADINIILTVYDDKITVSNQNNANLGILFQISEQLENWKRLQREIFKKEEEERINSLLEEWQKEKSVLQEKLLKNIQDTNSLIQEIKNERDILKARVETELKKTKIESELKKQKIDQVSSNQKNVKYKGIPVNPTRIQVREKKELDELKTTIRKQSEEIKILKQQYHDSAETFHNLYQTMDTLKTEINIKHSEAEYLKQQWAKTTRELNTCKKQYKNIQAKHTATHDSMLPLLIQQLLDSDAAEQKTDLQQLRSIENELNRIPKKRVQITDITDLSERDILMQTQTYSNKDKIIQLLDRKK